ncbi:MAG: 4Fe-4S dicluster domain-containing protein [Ruminococcus sp.]|nr:4Fe-4S dicluster domain-containing protein [Ruminococcus sp.]
MKIRLDILRTKRGGGSYLQSVVFEYSDPKTTVAAALTEINSSDQYKDTEGKSVDKIKWECSCLQKKCGACAMVIGGKPCLACDSVLSDFGERVRIEPLRKFPVIEDLIVDRSAIFDRLRDMQIWFEQQAQNDETSTDTAYEASRCLQCGCCLEVCPNFCVDENFVGMSAAVPASRLIAQTDKAQAKQLYELYKKRVYEGCAKSLACRNICPAGIDIDGLLVSSNAAAVWKRKKKRG